MIKFYAQKEFYISIKVPHSIITQRRANNKEWGGLLHLSSYQALTTKFMDQSPSWEANRFSACKEIPRIL